MQYLVVLDPGSREDRGEEHFIEGILKAGMTKRGKQSIKNNKKKRSAHYKIRKVKLAPRRHYAQSAGGRYRCVRDLKKVPLFLHGIPKGRLQYLLLWAGPARPLKKRKQKLRNKDDPSTRFRVNCIIFFNASTWHCLRLRREVKLTIEYYFYKDLCFDPPSP